MNPTAYPRTTADDLEAAASLEADLEEAHEAASLLGTPDLFVAVSHLLAKAAADLKEGRQPWGLLDGAHSAICDLRMEHGCEDWTQVPEWTIQACAVEFLWAEERLLREGADSVCLSLGV
jgi:hypothetical protein